MKARSASSDISSCWKGIERKEGRVTFNKIKDLLIQLNTVPLKATLLLSLLKTVFFFLKTHSNTVRVPYEFTCSLSCKDAVKKEPMKYKQYVITFLLFSSLQFELNPHKYHIIRDISIYMGKIWIDILCILQWLKYCFSYVCKM